MQDSVKVENHSYYVQVARANGVSEREIRTMILRNAVIPYINYVGVTIPSFFGGSIVVETLFGWSGLGQLLVKSVMLKDFPVLMGAILIIGVVVVICLFVIDILMIGLNPRLRRGDLYEKTAEVPDLLACAFSSHLYNDYFFFIISSF